jgi:acyl-CoA oxidase
MVVILRGCCVRLLIARNRKVFIGGFFGLESDFKAPLFSLCKTDFILTSPGGFEAAKCWCGNLGKTCTHGIVYAQLVVDGQKHGLNAFVVPLRDTKTLKPFPGVIVGDLGEKIGMHGVDNGFLLFDNYHIPRENFLSRTAEVTEDGRYLSKVKEGGNRFASFGALSETRVGICDVAGAFMTRAITIAIRYSAARKQFGPEDSKEEFPVIEYQAQQYRLFPHLAATFAVRIFGNWLTKHQGEISIKTIFGEKIGNIGAEMHALSSCAKSVCTWASRDLIQECREACGGHGYLRVAGLGDLRNDVDPSCTYEVSICLLLGK